ncbi:MAG: hypothetical protein RL363_1047, partial [Bacteroidota bacterium]|jgi:uncharacterized protein (DUF1684 family)
MKYVGLLLISSFFYFLAGAQAKDAYTDSVNDWHKMRIQYLMKPDGWLNLEGLFWLQKGKNTFGQAEENDCRYINPNPNAVFFPSHLGDFIYEGDSVVWASSDKYAVTIDKQLVVGGKKALVFKEKGYSPIAEWGQFSWTIIKREEKVGVRFRNLKSLNLSQFKGIERFAINANWRVKAKLIPPTQDFLMITNVLGQTTPSKNGGKLVFTLFGKEFSLDVMEEGGKTLFITFADETAGKTTYGAGRFIDVIRPDSEGNTVIDFNLAYNPPCAFTEFATCPLPPVQNRLAIAITAGEKNYGHH